MDGCVTLFSEPPSGTLHKEFKIRRVLLRPQGFQTINILTVFLNSTAKIGAQFLRIYQRECVRVLLAERGQGKTPPSSDFHATKADCLSKVSSSVPA
jgi:hypothetical protein